MNTTKRDVWGGKTPEPILLPDLPIVDAHIHLWQRDNYFVEDLLADVESGHRVETTVYVECGMEYLNDPREEFRPVGETRYVLEQVKLAAGSQHEMAAGILGAVDLTQGAKIRPVLEAHIEAGKGRFRGIRYRAAWDPDPAVTYREPGYPNGNIFEHPQFLEGANVMESMGLVLGLWGFHTQLPEMAKFAAALPNLTIVVDHVGGPIGVGHYAGQRAEVFKVWETNLRKVAAVPNTNLKLSGLAISRLGFGFQQNGQVSSSDELAAVWKPYIETGAEIFGADRSMFSSNYPVDHVAAPYPMLLNAYKKMLSGASESELNKIFADNARRVFDLPGK